LILHFSNKARFVKYKMCTSFCSKIHKILYQESVNCIEQLYFWKQVQIPNRIRIKNLGSNLTLNLG
jgi:hypothetical protein